jgi:hypothetical protein
VPNENILHADALAPDTRLAAADVRVADYGIDCGLGHVFIAAQ